MKGLLLNAMSNIYRFDTHHQTQLSDLDLFFQYEKKNDSTPSVALSRIFGFLRCYLYNREQ